MLLPDNYSNSTVCRQVMMVLTAILSQLGTFEVETILLQKSWQLSKWLKRGAGAGGGGDLESCHWSRGSVTSVARAAQADRQSSGQT